MISKDEAVRSVVDLYRNTERTDIDADNLKRATEYMSFLNDNTAMVSCLENNFGLLDEYERYIIELLETLPVTQFAKLCGISRMHVYRLLADDSRLRIYFKYKRKNENVLQ